MAPYLKKFENHSDYPDSSPPSDARTPTHPFSSKGPRGRGLGTRFSFRLSIQKLAPGPGQRKPRTPPTDAFHAAASRAGRRRAPASVRGSSLCGLRTRTRRGGDDGGAWRVETRWRGAARGDNGAIVPSPGSARTPSHIALQCADACPSGRRWRRRRHRTCVHRRARWRAPPSPVGNAKTHSTPSHEPFGHTTPQFELQHTFSGLFSIVYLL